MKQAKLHDQLATMSSKINEIENRKIPNQLEMIAAKLNEIENRKESIYAFRVTSVKNSGSSSKQTVNKNPGFQSNNCIATQY